jgi:hypothetical protein
MAEKIEQPDNQLQDLLDSVLAEEPTEFTFRGKKHMMGWLKKGAVRKFSHVIMKEKNEGKRNAKIAAILLLNNIWKIRFTYWLLWRYYYYIIDLDDAEVLRVVEIAKKKMPSTPSTLITILATAMTDLMMTMTKKEVQAIHHGQAGAAHTV